MTVLIFILLQICSAGRSLHSRCDAGAIMGKVIDAEDRPVAGAVVILCDQSSGIPFCKETFRPFTEAFVAKESNQQEEILCAVTDGGGHFSFEKVPVGAYRLVAQSWRDSREFKGVFEKNGEEIELHGVAEHVKVSPDTPGYIVLRPLGTGALRLDQEAGTLLVLSRSPTRADPILGFAGWGGAFMRDMLGGNRMIQGRTTVYGLPEGRVYLAMFANDNIPGWTEGQAQIKSNQTTVLENIPFVNSWSNSRHDPPEHLMPVFEEIQRLSPENRALIYDVCRDFGVHVESSQGLFGFMQQIAPHLEKKISLPSGKEAPFGEVIAATMYVNLQWTMERKREQWKKREKAEKKFLARRAAKEAQAQKEQAETYDEVDVSSPSSFFPDDVQAGEELDELWAVKNRAFSEVSTEEILGIVRRGFRRTSANRNDIVKTIGSKYIIYKSPSERAAVDILYCASFDPDLMGDAFYHGLTVAKPKSPHVLQRLADLALQGYGVGRTAWGVQGTQDQREEFVNLLKPYLEGPDPIERHQARNVIRVIEGKTHGVYDTSKGETNPETIEQVKRDFEEKLDQIRQTLLTGTSSSRCSQLERICSLGIYHLFDDTYIPVIQTCAKDASSSVRIRSAEIAGYYWIWGSTLKNSEITQSLIQLSEDEVPEVRLAAVEKGLFNVPDKTSGVIEQIVDVALADRKAIREKLYGRIKRVLYENRQKTRRILEAYLEGDQYDRELVTALYRDALRSEPLIIESIEARLLPANISAKILKGLGLAGAVYAREHDASLPRILQEFGPYVQNEHHFKWLLGNVEYFYRGRSGQRDAARIPVAYDRTLFGEGNGTNVLFLDFSVRFLGTEQLKKLGISEAATQADD